MPWITIDLDDETLEQLRAQAQHAHMPLTAFVRKTLKASSDRSTPKDYLSSTKQ